MKRQALVAGVIASLVALVGVPAYAADTDETDALEVLQDVDAQSTSVDTAVLENVSSVEVIEGEGASAVIAGEDIVLPSDTASPLIVGDLTVTLPSAGEAATAEPVTDGIAKYESSESFATVPVIKDDGSVQVLTIIDGESSPTEYAYGFPGSSSLVDAGGGAVLIVDAQGNYLGGVAPAWAVDATGKAVATHYELRDSQLVQVLDHLSQDVAYPVTADPWLGSNLFHTGGQPAAGVWVQLSVWGQSVHNGIAQGGGIGAIAAGKSIFYGAGWDEAKNRWPKLTTRETYHQQYDCHVLGAHYPLGGPTWDFEWNRANRPNYATDGGAWTYHCNWP
jgi:hypothetical protein